MSAGHAEAHPLATQWKQPAGDRPQLHVYNSLTRTKVPFHPLQSNRVRWYNCGPTVYDASHIGHARNYVTFDIIRRILEDYFSYDVTLIMNITDIDDKIILRARQKHLFEEYCKAHPVMDSSLVQELKESWRAFVQSKFSCEASDMICAWERLVERDEGGEKNGTPAPEEADAKMGMHFNTARAALSALESVNADSESVPVLQAFFDILAPELDAKYGSTVTDQKIFRDLAAFWEGHFLADMRALNVRPVSLMTRVTEFVPEVVDCIRRIVENGYAYEAQGSVYFDVAAFQGAGDHVYAKLCPWSAGNCKFFEEGEGAIGVKLAGKRDPRDFALWKAGKAGEPTWDSPWGLGRPGWHIECSAMAAVVAPGTLDIHSGGIDLAFPHHDNELAESEAYYESDQWVNYFMHAGHVHIEGHKMSKSLKNFITIRDALERYSARQLRIMFLQHHWHAPVYYKPSSMTTAVAVEHLFSNFFTNINALLHASKDGDASPCAVGAEEQTLLGLLSETQNRVYAFLCDNFDTPSTLLHLQDLVNRTNVYVHSSAAPNTFLLRMVGGYVTRMLRVFGVIESSQEDQIGFESSGSSGAQDTWSTVGPILEELSSFRDTVRTAALEKTDPKALLDVCDRLRDSLLQAGVLLEDRPGKATLVKLIDREAVARMRNEQAERDAEKLTRKMEMVRINEEKRAQKLAKAAVDPKTMFTTDPAFSKLDEQGIPTHGASGEELSKNARKKAAKEYEAQVELHQKFLSGSM